MSALLGNANELRLFPGAVGPYLSNFSLNQTTDALEFIFQTQEPIVITRLGIRQGIVTGTAPLYTIRLQGVDTTGIPNGTDKTGATATITPVAGGNNTWSWLTLGTSYTAAAGEWLAISLGTVGTVDASNFCSFTSQNGIYGTTGQPYGIQNDNTVRTKVISPEFGYGSSTQSYGTPAISSFNTAYNSASTPNERALRFNIPTTFCSSYKIHGITFNGALEAAGAFDLKIYDTNGTTVLQQTSFISNQDSSASGFRLRYLYFTGTPVALNAGSTYRLSVVPTTGNITVSGFTVPVAADMDAFPYGAAFGTGSSRAGGAWTDDVLTRYGINPLLSDITVAAASPVGRTTGARSIGTY